MGRNSVSTTIVPRVPNKEGFSKFWDTVVNAGILGLGYGVVSSKVVYPHRSKSFLPTNLLVDEYYVIAPEAHDNEPRAMETLVELLDYDLMADGNGQVPYGYEPDARPSRWEITGVLWYNPSAPSLYLLTSGTDIVLRVFKNDGQQIWEQIKGEFPLADKPWEFDEERLFQISQTSLRTIYIVQKYRDQWQAINKQVITNG